MTLLRRLTCFLPALLLLSLPAVAQTPSDGHTIEGDLMHPESVAYDAANEVFYAANIGKKLAPSAKDGDGFIARLSSDGSVETLRLLPASDDVTLHAPKGTVVLDGRLYTADIDRVVGFDLEEKSKIAEISLKDQGVSFLNDIAVMNDQTLLASATNKGAIYRVNLKDKSVTALDVDVPNANGIVYAKEAGVLYAVSFGGAKGGTLWTLELTNGGTVDSVSSRTIKEKGRFDGLVRRPNGQLLVSDWGVEEASDTTPALHQIGSGGTGSVTTIELPDWQGPADFDCSSAHGCWIPDLPGNAVVVVRPGERME